MQCPHMGPLYSRCFISSLLPICLRNKRGFAMILGKASGQEIPPLTVDMLAAIAEDARRSGALAELRLATACLLTFAGFLCFSELVTLRHCYILIQRQHMSSHIYSVYSNTAKLTGYARVMR